MREPIEFIEGTDLPIDNCIRTYESAPIPIEQNLRAKYWYTDRPLPPKMVLKFCVITVSESGFQPLNYTRLFYPRQVTSYSAARKEISNVCQIFNAKEFNASVAVITGGSRSGLSTTKWGN